MKGGKNGGGGQTEEGDLISLITSQTDTDGWIHRRQQGDRTWPL
jgi:hypothetical protein